MRQKLIYIFALSILFHVETFAQKGIVKADNLNIGEMLQKIDEKNFFHDPHYYNWCSSVIKGKDNKYHLFYSRWKKEYGYNGWLTHSEIAHAISDKPDKGYTFYRTILVPRKGYWDEITCYNPKIKYFDGKYYLYYSGSSDGDLNLNEKQLREVAAKGAKHPYWQIIRNLQRTGVAISSSLYDDFIPSKEPIVSPTPPFGNVANNPDVAKGNDNKYYMVIKGDEMNGKKWKLIQAIGTSDSPTGPFTFQNKPLFDEISTEDVTMWYDKKRNRFYAIFHAHGDNFIGLLSSKDGLNWRKATHYKICNKEIKLKNDSILSPDRMERPEMFIEGNSPKVLNFAVKKGDDAWIVFIPLK